LYHFCNGRIETLKTINDTVLYQFCNGLVESIQTFLGTRLFDAGIDGIIGGNQQR
jgi:hypothetical protein